MKRKIITIVLMLTLALTFVFTACGDGENTPAGSPSAPLIMAVATADGIMLTWSEPLDKGESDIIRYEVSIDNGSTWIDAGLLLRYTFTEVTAGMRYTLAVRAVNMQGAGKTAFIDRNY